VRKVSVPPFCGAELAPPPPPPPLPLPLPHPATVIARTATAASPRAVLVERVMKHSL
jgi:hypothetical protein